MDTSNEERKIFSEIQKRLFYMIPQKWDSIYLFASIIEESFKKSQGEMFFYYYPKGILKKNPINVYEIPGLFNIDEETYNGLINKLFLDIKRLHEIARERHPMIWTSITITVEEAIFKIEYNYDDIEKQKDFNPYERHVIWRYKYLGLDFDTLSKQEKEIITRYNDSIFLTRRSKEVYSETMYKQMTHNIIDYAKTISLETALALQKSEEDKVGSPREKLELLKRKNKKLKEHQLDIDSANNQILIGMKTKSEDEVDFGDELLTSEVMSSGKNKTKEVDENFDEILTTEKISKKTRKRAKVQEVEDELDFGDGLLTSDVMTKRNNKK